MVRKLAGGMFKRTDTMEAAAQAISRLASESQDNRQAARLLVDLVLASTSLTSHDIMAACGAGED